MAPLTIGPIAFQIVVKTALTLPRTLLTTASTRGSTAATMDRILTTTGTTTAMMLLTTGTTEEKIDFMIDAIKLPIMLMIGINCCITGINAVITVVTISMMKLARELTIGMTAEIALNTIWMPAEIFSPIPLDWIIVMNS